MKAFGLISEGLIYFKIWTYRELDIKNWTHMCNVSNFYKNMNMCS
ncbi:hypothetical protein SAMN04488101_101285 [Pedobacter nyackensis]|uniref:Uncharacterized protein n=1 Tax=Pedobacter nyackensis TaxID=475255 RepID=A0A1W2A7D3_9SPHI|nr:hypothetical protein SAMN04488101_101285 [Pedobacter nyackensis]